MHGGFAPVDAETRALERPGDHQDDLRLWLRLLTCAALIESEIRRRLRAQFSATLPRFDLMAQLHKSPDGLSLSALSRRMMVSNGNLTALVERLAATAHIARRQAAADRRTVIVTLTRKGAMEFARMARAHQGWVVELFGGLPRRERDQLMKSLALAKQSARAAMADAPPAINARDGRSIRGAKACRSAKA